MRANPRNGSQHTYLYTGDDERLCTLHVIPGQPGRADDELRDLDGKVLRAYTYEDGGGTEVWRLKRDYVYRGSQLLQAFTSHTDPSQRVHYTLDHLGSPRLVTNQSGQPVEDHHYMGYGRDYGLFAENAQEAMRFTGHQREKHAPGEIDDLDYMHARYYTPFYGRFLSVDPINSAKQDAPQSWNKYVYAVGNPLKYVDPDGEAVVAVNPPDFERNARLREDFRQDLGTRLPVIGKAVAAVVDSLVLSQVFPASREEWADGANATMIGMAAPISGGKAAIDDMLRSGQQLDRNGLTKAGRALQKHGDRAGSVFPKSAVHPHRGMHKVSRFSRKSWVV